MPTNRQRAVSVSVETRTMFRDLPSTTAAEPTSYRYTHTDPLPPLPPAYQQNLRTAVIDGDPFDIAIDWQTYSFAPPHSDGPSAHRAPPVYGCSILETHPSNRILVLNTANEKKPGGDWDSGVLGLGAEESLARRSNLVQTLTSIDTRREPGTTSYYPLTQTGGVYSPNTVVFRSGHEKDYAIWHESDWTTISVVSVAAVRRPKIDESGMHYSFIEERDLQREKMKTVLRLAAMNGHINLVLGGFGSCGPGTGHGDMPISGAHSAGPQPPPPTGSTYRNPVSDVCKLWHELLFESEEFRGYFGNVVFAIGGGESGGQREFRKYFG